MILSETSSSDAFVNRILEKSLVLFVSGQCIGAVYTHLSILLLLLCLMLQHCELLSGVGMMPDGVIYVLCAFFVSVQSNAQQTNARGQLHDNIGM